jgi:hypothetical protein
MKVCIGIICIGRTYISEFERLFKPSVQEYCNRWGYELKVFTDFLDSNIKHPSAISYQKALIPSHESMKDYDLVVILDADIYIASDAPPIHTIELYGKIGIVDERDQVSSQELVTLQERGFLESDYYKQYGFDLQSNLYLNSGLMVCSPLLHGDFLKSVYSTYVQKTVKHTIPYHFEQSSIGYELIQNNMFMCIPNEWNYICRFESYFGKYNRFYFLHFAGLKGHAKDVALRTYLAAHAAKRVS